MMSPRTPGGWEVSGTHDLAEKENKRDQGASQQLKKECYNLGSET